MNRFLLFLLLLTLSAHAAHAAELDPELTKKAVAVLERNCFRCHGKDGSNEGGVDYILDVKKLIDKRKVVPGAAEKSRLYLHARRQRRHAL
jgi:cytochrome c553